MVEPSVSQHRVDLLFPLVGSTVPRDHGYPLYAALSRLLDRPDEPPVVHGARDLGVFAIRGTPAGNGTLTVTGRSVLRLRIAVARLPAMLALAGKALELDGHRVRVGVPSVLALTPAATLASPLVLIKIARPPGQADQPPTVTPERFLDAVRRQLANLKIAAQPAIPLIRTGPRAGEPRRRVARVKDQTHAGYALLVEGLTAEESIRLQEAGLGGRRLMGCGLFLPASG